LAGAKGDIEMTNKDQGQNQNERDQGMPKRSDQDDARQGGQQQQGGGQRMPGQQQQNDPSRNPQKQ
jgi:hypothetical protein